MYCLSNKATPALASEKKLSKKKRANLNHSFNKKFFLVLLAPILSLQISFAQSFFSKSEESEYSTGGFFNQTPQERPPHDSTHNACSKTNPPWWCNGNSDSNNEESGSNNVSGDSEAMEAPLDDWLWVLPILGMVVGCYFLLRKRNEDWA